MDIEIVPEGTSTLKPIRTYETSYIYVGLRRFDTIEKKLQTITKNGDIFKFEEVDYSPQVLSRGYHTELVRVTEYSASPRIWKEEIGAHAYLFKQIQSS